MPRVTLSEINAIHDEYYSNEVELAIKAARIGDDDALSAFALSPDIDARYIVAECSMDLATLQDLMRDPVESVREQARWSRNCILGIFGCSGISYRR